MPGSATVTVTDKGRRHVRRIVDIYLRITDRLAGAAAALAMLLVAAMICTVLYEITARHVFNAPTIWAFDVGYMLNGSLFMLGAAYTLRQDAHVRIDFVLERLPRRLCDAMQAAFYLLVFAPVLGLATAFAIGRARRAFERGTLENASAWEPLVWPFLAALSLGMTLLVLQTVAEGLRHLLALTGTPAPARDR